MISILRFSNLLIFQFFFFSLFGQNFELVRFSDGFRRPVDISNAGDDRLFVTEKDGTIMILYPDGSKSNNPFLDIRTRVNAFASERGLLGLSFHPDYQSNGYFYVHYTNLEGSSTISRFTADAQNDNFADPDSELIMLVVQQPSNNHNAGALNFGPDGYLYVAMGDGGGSGDPGNRSQNPKNLLGKMLRLDVNAGVPYAIPPDNPFVNNPDTLHEIWSLGFRNPWRFSFDKLTGDMWIADVGQNKWEEINMEPSGKGGLNYGWRCYEGYEAFNLSGCGSSDKYTFPVHIYPNRFDVGCSATGGYVYRGHKNPSLRGKYVYADYCSGKFWTLVRNMAGEWMNEEIGDFENLDFSSFGEDINGELYVAGLASGTIYKITDNICAKLDNEDLTFEIISPMCPETCSGSVFTKLSTFSLTANWSNQVLGDSVLNLCSGIYSVEITDTLGCKRVEMFELSDPQAEMIGLVVKIDTIYVSNPIFSAYQWYFNGVKLEQESLSYIIPNETGNYNVTALSDLNCKVESDTISFILSTTHDSAVSDFKILTNPIMNNILVWNTDYNKSRNWFISSNLGVILKQKEFDGPKENYFWDLSDLPAGIYYLLNGHKSHKFLKI